MDITVRAHAKLNLTLDVVRRREDGYHDMKMVMQSVSLDDRIRITTGTGERDRVRSNLTFLPTDERNLALRAARLYCEASGADPGGLLIQMQKQIPVCAGMGGGSADAAAVMLAMHSLYPRDGLGLEELCALGETLGSDVPFCIRGGTALAEGRGERLTPLRPLPDCRFVICKPPFSVSTPALFGKLRCQKIRHRPDTEGVLAAIERGDLADIARHMYNVFEPLVAAEHREVREIQQSLISAGALGACMSGTGPTVFGLFDDTAAAEAAAKELKASYSAVFVASPL